MLRVKSFRYSLHRQIQNIEHLYLNFYFKFLRLNHVFHFFLQLKIFQFLIIILCVFFAFLFVGAARSLDFKVVLVFVSTLLSRVSTSLFFFASGTALWVSSLTQFLRFLQDLMFTSFAFVSHKIFSLGSLIVCFSRWTVSSF